MSEEQYWTLVTTKRELTYCEACALVSSNIGFQIAGYEKADTMLEAAQRFNEEISGKPECEGEGIKPALEGPCENPDHDIYVLLSVANEVTVIEAEGGEQE